MRRYFPVVIGIAIFKYRLYAIDLIINRTLVYGGLTLMVVLLYTLTVGGLGLLFHTAGNFITSLLATALIAIVFQPARERLQRNVNRLMFGRRDDPYAVLSHLSRQLQNTAIPAETLTSIVETIAAQKYNESDKISVYGIVTNGDAWELGKLTQKLFVREPGVFPLRDLNELLGAVEFVFHEAEAALS